MMPQCVDGQMMEPRVSDPSVNGASAAEVMAPDPLDEPHVQ